MPQHDPTDRDQFRDVVTDFVYDFIKQYVDSHGFSPSIADIARGCHMSRSNAMRYLDRLEAFGRITREPGVARSITLLTPPESRL